MSDNQTKEIVAQQPQRTLVVWTEEQKQLIMRTVAKDATPDEFKLFLYRCQHMELDPLVPGMVHFVKYGNNPGTMVVGIDGFRLRALRTGKHNGTKRALMFDDKGKCVGASCEVFRTDWEHPARIEVDMAEYTTGKAMWQKMPRTMIQKVAEAAALRMAFPDALSGVYEQSELDQAADDDEKRKQKDVTPPKQDAAPATAPPAPKAIEKPAKPAAPPPPVQKVDYKKMLNDLVDRADARGITREELGAYVTKAFKVENAHGLNGRQIKELYDLLMDESTDAKLIRYLANPEAFEQQSQPEEELDGTESFRV